MSLFNPYILLALTVVLAGSNFYSYNLGGDHKENEVKAEYSRQQDAAIKEANENAQIDMQAAREVGQREARARVITRTITNEVVKVIHEKPAPAICAWDDRSFGLLDAAIKAANDLTSAAKPVPNASPAVKAASKP